MFNEPRHFLIVAERKEVLGLRFHKAPSSTGDQIQGLPFSKKENLLQCCNSMFLFFFFDLLIFILILKKWRKNNSLYHNNELKHD